MPIINSTRGVFGPQSLLLASRSESVLEVLLFGAGGGSGSSNRTSTSYRTANYYRTKEGGAGGVVLARYTIKAGTTIGLSVGGAGRGGGQQGNPSSASGGYNGGGNGTYCGNDMSGGGGGYTCIFVPSIGKNQNGIIALAPGGGGGGGGPGYPANNNGQANGGGGITTNGVGNAGTRQYGYFIAVAGGGTLTSGGVGGDTSRSDGDGSAGSALVGANAIFYNNAWGTGGGGGAGWFGGGSGANDGDSWDGGGGGAGSAFVRGSGLSYNAAGLSSITNISYVSHTFYTQTYGTYGDGSNPSYGPIGGEKSDSGALNSMRMPVQTTNPQYPGNTIGYGGQFNNAGTGGFVGLDGRPGAIVYRINGGVWTTVNFTGSDTTITV